jgi:hypothetical protein
MPKKICIVTPGRSGSLWLMSLLGPYYCDRPDDIVHTHDSAEAYRLEEQGWTVIVSRRRDMFEWTLSREISNILPVDMGREDEYHAANQNKAQLTIDPEQYVKVRDEIRDELKKYKDSWYVCVYEDLLADPMLEVYKILNCKRAPLSKQKLKYNKKELVSNYDQLKQIEDSATFAQYRSKS